VPAAITSKTRAIMPVHFAGLPVDMEALYGLAAQHGLRIVEDAAHAIGSRYADKPIGSFGDLVVFSFHPNKNMTTIEGGAISTGDAMAAELIEQYRFHGIKRNAAGEVDVMFPGAKSNLTDIAAQVGIDQLRRLDGFNARRRALAAPFFPVSVKLPARCVFHDARSCIPIAAARLSLIGTGFASCGSLLGTEQAACRGGVPEGSDGADAKLILTKR